MSAPTPSCNLPPIALLPKGSIKLTNAELDTKRLTLTFVKEVTNIAATSDILHMTWRHSIAILMMLMREEENGHKSSDYWLDKLQLEASQHVNNGSCELRINLR